PEDSNFDPSTELSLLQDELEEYRARLADRDYGAVVQRTAARLAALAGSTIVRHSDAYHQLCEGVLRSWCERNRINMAVLNGRFDEITPRDPLLIGLTIPDRPMLDGEATEASSKTLYLLIERYCELKTASRIWNKKTLNENRRVLLWFAELLGKDKHA